MPPDPLLSISRAHVDYNYPQVITTHTTVFQWALTAVRPPYSAKLVFPFPPCGPAGQRGGGRSRETREGEGRRKKGGTSGGQRSLLDPSPPFLSDLAAPLPPLPTLLPSLTSHCPSPRTLVAGVRGRVYFFNLPEDRQLDFLGSFGYRINVRLIGIVCREGRGGRPGSPNAPQIRSRGNVRRGTTYTCPRGSCI